MTQFKSFDEFRDACGFKTEELENFNSLIEEAPLQDIQTRFPTHDPLLAVAALVTAIAYLINDAARNIAKRDGNTKVVLILDEKCDALYRQIPTWFRWPKE